ncbi:hypothetical protein [Streptomyces sp. MMBL 11-1]|uniref:hypothetical protein n=1 Tax=Streptomyces sp. MMBL 11-1 TaxID=3026420 RepID=UPI00235F1ED0|nr:hypothetical protein [Streptomyces sp. MMBL 11-1]
MPTKITFIASTVASAATAFGIGALVFTSPDAPELAVPQQAPIVATTPDATEAAKPVPATSPSSTTTPLTLPPVGKHAKPTTVPEKTAQAAPKGKHAKPSAKPTTQPAEAGSKGLLKDAEGDGKILDDVTSLVVPGLPEVPDEWLPFPDEEGNPGHESPDADWGDPGLVCDPELAERLGVELSPTCSRDDNDGPADTWTPEETWEAPGGTWGPFVAL